MHLLQETQRNNVRIKLVKSPTYTGGWFIDAEDIL